MAKYFLTNKAINDLSEIWEYTYEVWSKNQADKYYNSIIEDCKELAENPILGRNYVEISDELFGLKSGNHIIFYKILNYDRIEVFRILHSKMDLKNRLKE